LGHLNFYLKFKFHFIGERYPKSKKANAVPEAGNSKTAEFVDVYGVLEGEKF
jgi:hypothetical protein